MKSMMFLGTIVSLLGSLTFSQNNDTEYTKAMERLDSGKELYFLIHLNSSTDIKKLSSIVSLDKIRGDSAIAYASKEDFIIFYNTMHLAFEVKPHPGEREDILLSDCAPQNTQLNETIRYPSYDSLLSQVRAYESRFPDLCKYYEVGKTVKGRTIPGLVLTNINTTHPKPRVLFCGPPHGNELTGLILNMMIYDSLTKGYMMGDQRIKRLLDSVEILTVTLLNPDGTYKGGNNTVVGAQRSNANGVDINRSHLPAPGCTSEAQQQPETKALQANVIC